ncbi:MAG: hypothetical protein QG635_1601 [Bacteroidota bacterium]|nr:hypothetical protein [Bacteroidota bacterium]
MAASKYRSFILPFSLLLFILIPAASQIDYKFYTGARKGSIDTIAYETSQKIVKETSGLFEKEIDPMTYIMGPNDVITISIISANSKQFDVNVLPEGYVQIPDVGQVSVKGLSLHQAEEIINAKIKQIYKADEVYTALREARKFKVAVSGELRKSSIVSATGVDRVSEIIEKAGGMTEKASLRNNWLIRGDDKRKIPVDLLKFIKLDDKNSNPTVLGGDHIIVNPIDNAKTIGIYGEVAMPGTFEFVQGDSLYMLIMFAQGFLSTALLDSVEISRYEVSSGNNKHLLLDLSSWTNSNYLTNNLANNIPLEWGDRVFIRKNTNIEQNALVSIMGEVKYPGYYSAFTKNERLSSILERAGGFTEDAYLQSAVYLRKKELKVEDKEMERLWRTNPIDRSLNEQRYFNARVTEKKGEIALNLSRIMEDSTCDENIVVMDEDSLFIPSIKDFVNVQGRVNNPGLVVYKNNYNYLDYINLAGGFGYRADESSTLIVKSKGEQFLAKDMNYTIERGDNILVPPVKELSSMEIISTALTIVTQIVTVLGVIVALTRM